jgi:hypothetical protein
VAYAPGSFKDIFGTPLGQRLWPCLNEPTNVSRMTTATQLGRPAAEGVEDVLLEQFGEAVFEDRVKQMIGHMIRQVMEANGYVIDTQNVKLAGYPFSRATRYMLRTHRNYHLWHRSTDARAMAVTSSANSATLPSDEGEWLYVGAVQGELRATVAFGMPRAAEVNSALERQGFVLYWRERVLKKAA